MNNFYKLVRQIDGKLYPLYVNASTEIPVGVWLDAVPGPLASDGKHVKSRLGNLAYRPLWHGCAKPVALHIGKRDADGNVAYRRPEEIWVKCEAEGVQTIKRPMNQIWLTAKRIRVTEIIGKSPIDLPEQPN